MNKRNFYGIFAGAALVAAALGCSGEDPTGSNLAGSNRGDKPGKDDGNGGATNGDSCTYTQGFWKNHASAWPVTSLQLGNTEYSKEELLSIFRTPVKGNGLVSMAHQLIAAKLNVAAGAAPDAIAATIEEADALIADLVVPPVGDGRLATAETSALNDRLADFNEGQTGPGHCDSGTGGTGGVGGDGSGGAGGSGGNGGDCSSGGSGGHGGDGGSAGDGGSGGDAGSSGSAGAGGSGGDSSCPDGVEPCDASGGACSVGQCVNGCCVEIA